MSNSVYCIVKIKQEQVPWNWNQQNPSQRRQKQEEVQKKFQNDFYKLINTVVSLGGTVCLDRHTLDNEWRLYNSPIRLKLGTDFIDKIRSLDFIESLAYDSRVC
jgi:hypothetical protein